MNEYKINHKIIERKYHINKFRFRELNKFCTLLRSCKRFEIVSGKMRVTVPSTILIVSLLGLGDFDLIIYSSEERCKFIEDKLYEYGMIDGKQYE